MPGEDKLDTEVGARGGKRLCCSGASQERRPRVFLEQLNPPHRTGVAVLDDCCQPVPFIGKIDAERTGGDRAAMMFACDADPQRRPAKGLSVRS
jgi:hypothetical protein